ncbi:MAG: acetylaminoadipate kinase, partial [Thermoproteota archaeon]
MIVVKVGGRTLKNIEAIARDLIDHQPFVLIHGGRDFVTEYSKKMGVEPKIVTSPSGVRSRYTDEDELEVFVMVMAGKVNKEIVSKLLDLGIKAVGIS